MDELYAKEKNVPQIDLEAFGNAYISKVEEQQFKLDMAALQREVDLLEEGKCRPSASAKQLDHDQHGKAFLIENLIDELTKTRLHKSH